MPDAVRSWAASHVWPLWAGTARESTNAKLTQVRGDHPDAVVRIYFMGSRQQAVRDLPIAEVPHHQALVDAMSAHGAGNYLWIATTPGGTMKALGIVSVDKPAPTCERATCVIDAKFW